MRLTLLAPEVVEAIMTGNEPDGLKFKNLTAKPITAIWNDQFKMFGLDK